MRRGMTAGLWAVALVEGRALEPLAEHIDVVPEYSVAEAAWSWRIGTDGGDREAGEVFFPLRDLDTPGGELFLRPGGEAWDFLGIAENEEVWILPQSDGGHTWPGIENGQSGLFGSYVESDPRAAGLDQRWIRISLTAVEGPGEFSLFQFQGGGPLVWMSTAEGGIEAQDVFFLASPGHSHMNWAFSARGIYRIALQADAYLGPGPTDPTGPGEPVDLFFAVGARAEWRAGSFDADEVMAEAIAGDEGDPDGDGVVNLLEYAFGTDPRRGDPRHLGTGFPAGPEWRVVEVDGLKYPALRYFRRVNEDADVEYAVEWSQSLESGWEIRGVEEEVEDFDGGWQRVTVRDTGPITGRRFGRVSVTTAG